MKIEVHSKYIYTITLEVWIFILVILFTAVLSSLITIALLKKKNR